MGQAASQQTGATGQTGPAGPMGPIGAIGLTGSLGPAGNAGPTGMTGLTGSLGPAGAIGPSGPAGTSASTTNSVFCAGGGICAVPPGNAFQIGTFSLNPVGLNLCLYNNKVASICLDSSGNIGLAVNGYNLQDFAIYSSSTVDLPGNPITGTLANCQTQCSSNAACVGFSRQKSAAATDSSQQCYLKKDLSMASSANTANPTWQTYMKL